MSGSIVQGKKIYDVIGIGFGPSNLALAVAIEEQYRDIGLRALFLEQKRKFSWHPDMLLPGTEMQISFLKDLVTLRNPSSYYSFLNYLKSVNRLSSFANLRHFYPSRIEFNDYFSWVAKSLDRYVHYGRRVQTILPCGTNPCTLFEIVSEDVVSGNIECFFAKNIVVAPGGTPTIPFPVQSNSNSQRIWHSSAYLNKISAFKSDVNKPYHFAIIGRGQSAAEIICDIHGTFPNAKITSIYRGFGLKPADESEFVNEIFDSKFVDFMHATPSHARNKILTEHYDTNYSVVDADLIQQLYKTYYEEKVTGRHRLNFKNLSVVTEISEKDEKAKIDITSASSSLAESLDVDAVVLATGYTYPNPPKVLDSLRDYLLFDKHTGSALINRHYRASTDSRLKAGVYVQGCNENTHGLSDTLLSVLPIRAEEILSHITATQEDEDAKGFLQAQEVMDPNVSFAL